MAVTPAAGTSAPSFDAFLSYSHQDRAAVDGLQKALQRIARPLGKPYALRIFRDDTDLGASPDLWAKVVEGMNRSRFFVLVLSPAAAASPWVSRELHHWLTTRGPQQLLLVLAGGQLHWDPNRRCFAPELSNAAVPLLASPGALPAEPAYLDVSDQAPWDPRSSAFRTKVTGLAALIHKKDRRELENDDLRELRRQSRVRAIATFALTGLTTAALVLTGMLGVSWRQIEAERQQVVQQRNLAVALQLAQASASLRGTNNPLALALAREAVAANPADPPPESSRALTNARGALVEPGLHQSEAPQSLGKTPLSVAYVRAQDLFLVGARDGSLRLWSSQARGEVGEPLLAPSDNRIFKVAAGGQVLAAAGDEGVRQWRASSREQLASLDDNPSDAVTVSSDGTLLAWFSTTWSEDPPRLIKVHTADGTRSIKVDQWINDLAFSPDGKLLAGGGAAGLIRVWDLETFKPVFTGKAEAEAGVASVAFSDDGRWLATAEGGERPRARLFDRSAQYKLTLLGAQRDTVSAIAFSKTSADSTVLATGATDGTVQLWAPGTGEALGPAAIASPSGVSSLTFMGPDGRSLIGGSDDGRLWLWKAVALGLHEASSVQALALDPRSDDGSRFISAAGSAVNTWRDGGWDRQVAFDGTPWSVQYSKDGTRFAVAGRFAPAIYDTDSLKRLVTARVTEPEALTQGFERVALSPDGRRLMAAGGDQILQWDAASGEPVGDPISERDVLGATYSPDSALIAYGGKGEVVQVADLSGRQRFGLKLADWVMDIGFSPDGTLLAVASADGVVTLVNVADGSVVRQLPGNRDRVFAVAFSPDGSWLASASRRDGVRLWRLSDGLLVGHLLQPPAEPGAQTYPLPDTRTVAISPDGRTLLAGNGTLIQQWTDLFDVAGVCGLVEQSVTRAQVQPYLPSADWKTACNYR